MHLNTQEMRYMRMYKADIIFNEKCAGCRSYELVCSYRQENSLTTSAPHASCVLSEYSASTTGQAKGGEHRQGIN